MYDRVKRRSSALKPEDQKKKDQALERLREKNKKVCPHITTRAVRLTCGMHTVYVVISSVYSCHFRRARSEWHSARRTRKTRTTTHR